MTGYEYVCYDPEGLGSSPADWSRFQFSHWIENAEHALLTLEAPQAVLVGSSLGGLIATKLALKHRQKLKAMVWK